MGILAAWYSIYRDIELLLGESFSIWKRRTEKVAPVSNRNEIFLPSTSISVLGSRWVIGHRYSEGLTVKAVLLVFPTTFVQEAVTLTFPMTFFFAVSTLIFPRLGAGPSSILMGGGRGGKCLNQLWLLSKQNMGLFHILLSFWASLTPLI